MAANTFIKILKNGNKPKQHYKIIDILKEGKTYGKIFK